MLDKLLDHARGSTQFVIALNLDIRGFSHFSLSVDPAQSAFYIRQVYRRLIRDYFKSASFFKTTGDGLLVVFHCDEESIASLVNDTIEKSFDIISKWPTLVENEPLINFPVPQHIGIGITMGTACCLSAKGKILDYSGKTLNLCARLMDFARPSGIVFDQGLPYKLLADVHQRRFKSEKVYIRGIAESTPVAVYYSEEFTRISPRFKEPFDEVAWETESVSLTVAEVKKLGPKFYHDLKLKPIDSKEIIVSAKHPLVRNGRLVKNAHTDHSVTEWTYSCKAGEPRITMDYEALYQYLKKANVPERGPVSILIKYPKLGGIESKS